MFTIKSVVYSDKIRQRVNDLRHVRRDDGGNAVGTEANFACGSFVRFVLSIDPERSFLTDAAFNSNGCGFMLAAADVLAESVTRKHLTGLHGLSDVELQSVVEVALGPTPSERTDCFDACINALRAAFADYRSSQIEEFRGERALICTCFDVTEDTIERMITERSLETVDDVARVCNAGSGCGSCRMLIQEMLDGV
ncbi:hypothetical protein BH10ACI3_BH10ACI3_25010 [soil metagenome]